MVGSAFREGFTPTSFKNNKGFVRGLRRAHRQADLWIFHTIPQKGESGYDTWLNDSDDYTGNTGVWTEMTVDPSGRSGLSAGRAADPRLLRRPSSGRGPVTATASWRWISNTGKVQMVFPADPSRDLGLRHVLGAAADRHQRQRQAGQGGGTAHQAGHALCVRPHHRQADLADPGAQGREGHRAGRMVCADPAHSQQAESL